MLTHTYTYTLYTHTHKRKKDLKKITHIRMIKINIINMKPNEVGIK